MQQLILVIYVIAAISIIALVLLQYGKGADAGAAFGSGASNTMFGSRGAVPFLAKVTSVLAAVFFATCITLNYMAHSVTKKQDGVIDLSNPAPTTVLPPVNVPQQQKKTDKK